MSALGILDPLGAVKRRAALIIAGAGALAIILLLAWALRLDHLRGEWQGKFDVLSQQAGTVLVALRLASDNPELEWTGAAGQAQALGDSKRDLEAAIEVQNRRVDELAREAVRLQAKAAELQLIADQAKAQRRAALARLSDLSITPGTREDCTILLREAEDALDLIYEAGL
ncbi:hypothetical protein [Allopontixanthobacter sp.]|uniref:hypothetical protein n=1 Tax=Allopontixanthobacter sp. TaxID=2906452 RepID=UPI002ABB152E|nr:hypothetical protein [Allopontixanthobacter sp.]MDZ4307543.1 hypothetical protein [Allopontixanthobacter sp.]